MGNGLILITKSCHTGIFARYYLQNLERDSNPPKRSDLSLMHINSKFVIYFISGPHFGIAGLHHFGQPGCCRPSGGAAPLLEEEVRVHGVYQPSPDQVETKISSSTISSIVRSFLPPPTSLWTPQDGTRSPGLPASAVTAIATNERRRPIFLDRSQEAVQEAKASIPLWSSAPKEAPTIQKAKLQEAL